MDTKKIITLALVGVGVYFAWTKLFKKSDVAVDADKDIEGDAELSEAPTDHSR